MDDSMDESVFDDGASSDFAPPAKTAKAVKAKAASKKAAAPKARAPAKPKTKAPAKKKVADDENSDIDMDEDPLDDESLLADTPPKQKKAPGPKKTSGKPLADIANESFGIDDAAPAPGKKAAGGAGGASSKYQMVSLP